MSVRNEKFTITTRGFDEVIDITRKVCDIAESSETKDALVSIGVYDSASCITVIEDEISISTDIKRLLDEIVPINRIYQHDTDSDDGNAHAHLKSALLGNSVNIPLIDGRVFLNHGQKIVLIDFDNKTRVRNIVVSVIE